MGGSFHLFLFFYFVYFQVILSGPNVEKNTHLGINVIRKRASGSRVTFFGIKILTAYEDITLTATLYYTPAEAIRKLFHDEDLAVIASTISDPFSVVGKIHVPFSS